MIKWFEPEIGRDDLTIVKKCILKNYINEGDVVFNSDYPDGTPRKMIDSSKLMRLGWKPEINLKKGLHSTYEWFKENFDSMRK